MRFVHVWTALCIAQRATAQGAEVRLGGLFQHKASEVGRFAAFVMAVREINNSTDLLPHNELRCEPPSPPSAPRVDLLTCPLPLLLKVCRQRQRLRQRKRGCRRT